MRMDAISRYDRLIGLADLDNALPWIVSIPLSTTSRVHFLQVYERLRVVIILRGLFVGAVPLPITPCRQQWRRRSLLVIRLMQVLLYDRYVNPYREISRVTFNLGKLA